MHVIGLAGVRPRRARFNDRELGRDELPQQLVARVRHAAEERIGERSGRFPPNRAIAPGVGADRGLEEDVVGERLSDAVEIVCVLDSDESPDECVAIECHGATPASAGPAAIVHPQTVARSPVSCKRRIVISLRRTVARGPTIR